MPALSAWRCACLFFEESQQPTIPQVMHMRRCTRVSECHDASEPFDRRVNCDEAEMSAAGGDPRRLLISKRRFDNVTMCLHGQPKRGATRRSGAW